MIKAISRQLSDIRQNNFFSSSEEQSDESRSSLKKIKIYKNIKVCLTFSLYIALTLTAFQLSGCIQPAYAQTATSSAKPSTSPSASPDSMKNKLEALKAEIASKAAAIKNQVSTKLQNKVYAGVVGEVTSTKIVLTTKNGTRNIAINEYTEINSKLKTKSAKQLKISDIKVNDYIAGLGDVDDNNLMTAKKVYLVDKPVEDITTLLWGQIVKTQGSKITLKNKDGEEITINAGKTSFHLGSMDGSILDAKTDKFLIARGVLKDKTLTSSFIYYIPKVGFITPEASKSASPSATPKK